MRKIFPQICINLLSVMALCTGCNAVQATPTADVLATIVAQTLTAVPAKPTTPTATLEIPTNAQELTSTPEAIGTRYVYTQSQNVNLRVNPGRSFKVSRVLAQGTRLQLLGVAPGRQWLNVVNDEGVIGWVGADFVSGGFDGPPPPVVNPKDVQAVVGAVYDASGKPVSGIGFAIFQAGQREDAATDETGTFYAFLPTKFSGNWDVGFDSMACTSNIVDASCKCQSGACKPDPLSVTITLPLSAPLSFVWR